MSSEKQSPNTVAQSDPLAACAWSQISYAKTSDNLRASCGLYSIDSTSDSLIATDFGFSVPEGATIDGIEIAVELRANPTTAIDIVSRLRYNGADYGTSSNDRETFPINDTVKYIGGESDLWGASLTPSIINSSGFGVSIALADNSAPTVAEIDSIAITVYYTTAAAVIDEYLVFSASAEMSPAESLGAGGNVYTESLTFSAGAALGDSAGIDAGAAIGLSAAAFMLSGHTDETAGIRILSATGDYSVHYNKIVQLKESWKRDFQVLKYADGHNRIYLKSSWRKTWTLTIWPSDTHKTLITALRTETGDLRFFPLYKYDKSTFYKVRVDVRAPLYYHSGQGDAETLLSLIFYEVR